MCAAHRALLFRLSDLSLDTLSTLHTANDCHWTPKPLQPLGRFLVDCSNASPGVVPLNGGCAKELGIARYQKVSLPTIPLVISAWDVYRRACNVQWSDLILFKEDVSGAFNQLHWSPASAKLLCAMVDDDVVFMMLTGGFGHCVTPMIWSIVGDAISRLASASAQCPLHTFVDDTFGAGLPHHVEITRTAVQTATRNVLGPSAVAEDKSLCGPSLEILGFHIDMLSASIRPKDLALDKLFFCFFHLDLEASHPLETWQCLASLVQFYSPGLRGMQSFVAPFHHMTALCTSSRRYTKRRASANAAFCIVVWRAVSTLLSTDRNALAVPLDLFVSPSPLQPVFDVVSDASPWRLATALYHSGTSTVLAWSTLLLPFAAGAENKFQLHREYLGYILSLFLLLAYARPSSSTFLPYRWINDNLGALAWAAKHRCSSSSSVVACFVSSQLHLLRPLLLLDTCHLPGAQMGEIDAMSRRKKHPDLSSVCHSLLPSLYIPLDSELILSLFHLCDPAGVLLSSDSFSHTYITVLDTLRSILSSVTFVSPSS
jgi:hypothetical protein